MINEFVQMLDGQPPVISVVVPVYNSAATLPILVDRMENTFSSRLISYEILLIDDRSTDNSWEIIKKITEENRCVLGYRMPDNSGQFVTTISGSALTKGEYIVHIDDDLEYDPEEILLLYDRIRDKNLSVVFGIAKEKYAIKGSNPSMAIWRNRFLNFIWNKYPTDSFRIVRRDILFEGDSFIPKVHFEAFISRKVPFAEVGYVPVSLKRRIHGTSNHSFLLKLRLFIFLTADYTGIGLQHLFFALFAFSIMMIAGFGYILSVPISVILLQVLKWCLPYKSRILSPLAKNAVQG